MFSSIWASICAFFSRKTVGILIKTILVRASTVALKELMDADNQKKAYQFVKELNAKTDMSNYEKAQIFNLKMLDWAKTIGKKMTDSTINCLRELAVNAIKSEKEDETK